MMRFQLPTEIADFDPFLPRFAALLGPSLWRRRAAELMRLAESSPFQSHLVQQYHWLELELAYLAKRRRQLGRLTARMESAQSYSALYFAAAVVELDARLSPKGRNNLRGRLRDGLKAKAGFGPIYLEVIQAVQTMAAGFDLSPSDLEGIARHDLSFQKGPLSLNIECKHLSVDAGRQIHQRDFYRLMEDLRGNLERETGPEVVPAVISIILSGRMPTSNEEYKILLSAVRESCTSSTGSENHGKNFAIYRSSYASTFGLLPLGDAAALKKAAQGRFGANCHLVSTGEQGGKLTIVVSSEKEDDHSKPQLTAMKSALKQLPSDDPAVICLQFDDLSFEELMSSSVAEHFQLLANYFFRTCDASHVARVEFSAYQPTIRVDAENFWCPVVRILNPNFPEDKQAKLMVGDNFEDEVASHISQRVATRQASQEELNKAASSAAFKRRRARMDRKNQ